MSQPCKLVTQTRASTRFSIATEGRVYNEYFLYILVSARREKPSFASHANGGRPLWIELSDGGSSVRRVSELLALSSSS